MCKVQNRFKDLMHFSAYLGEKYYINDWVKGLRICSSCDRARHVVRICICMPEPTAARRYAGGYRWRYAGGTAGGIVDTAGGSKYLRSGRG